MPSADGSFDKFVAAHVRDLMNTAYLLSRDESEAEDLVQECLVRVAKRWGRVRAMDLPAAYARRILVNLAIDDGRRQSRRRQELGDAGNVDQDTGFEAIQLVIDEQAEAALEAITTRAPLLDALRRLSPQQRAVIVLRYFHDLSEAETARLLGCGVGTVKSSSAHALGRLRDIVEPQRARNENAAPRLQPGRTEP